MTGPLRVRFVERRANEGKRLEPDPDGTIVWVFTRDDCAPIAVWPWCPQCKRNIGYINISPGHHVWNGDLDRPTLMPSLLSAEPRCPWHFFVRDGQIIDAGTPPHGEVKP